MPTIEVLPVKQDDASVLQQLVQFYLYDFSEFHPLEVNAHGLFTGVYLDRYWLDDHWTALLFRVDGAAAGFALIRRGTPNHERGAFEPELLNMVEFFVMRRYRRLGVGTAAAITCFRRFEGPWQLEVLDTNTAARTFWQKVIGQYTGDHYRIFPWTENAASVFYFESPPKR
ncbi:MAG TPA: GNAT family N-acetyltransferase [Aggregatilineales bacterium]|nr:GNAT family N-acetyltransferase [Aggregatilineales bacterium]